MSKKIPTRRNSRAERRRRKYRRERIILCILTMAVICGSVIFWISQNYVLLGNSFISRDTMVLDLQGKNLRSISSLRNVRNLRSVDLRGNPISMKQCQAFLESHPDCEIVWDVPLLGERYASTSTQLDFTTLSYTSDDTAEIAQALSFFPNLSQVDMRNCPLSRKEMQQIFAENPQVQFLWDFDVLGQRHVSTETSIDLSGTEIPDEAELLETLTCFDHLESANLMGCGLSMDCMKALRIAMPETSFAWDFSLFGVTTSTEKTTLNLSGRSISPEDLQTLRDGIFLLPELKTLDMCDCGLSNETMAALRKEYPDIKVVWRVYFADWSVRTDASAFSTNINSSAPRYTSQDFDVLKYCTDLMSLDLGHQAVDDLSFLQDMVNLRILILVDNKISDISMLANLTQLEYVELFLNDIVDISPLSGLENLIDLNLYGCFIEDATPLYGLQKLERLWIARNELERDQRKALEKALPNCEVNFTADSATSEGWRRHPRYTDLLEIIQTNVWHDWTEEEASK